MSYINTYFFHTYIIQVTFAYSSLFNEDRLMLNLVQTLTLHYNFYQVSFSYQTLSYFANSFVYGSCGYSGMSVHILVECKQQNTQKGMKYVHTFLYNQI